MKKVIPTRENMQASKPKDYPVYEGWSYEGRKCPKHKVKLVKDDHVCCECCCGGGCPPMWHCPRCEKLYWAAFSRWHRKWGHIVAVASEIVVRNGKIYRHSSDLRYMECLHGGKPLKEGQWCTYNDQGYIKRVKNPSYPMMLVVE